MATSHLEATLTVRAVASAAAHALRDASRDSIDSVNDLYRVKGISAELDAGVKGAEQKLNAAAKKVGLLVNSDVSYGMHGAKEGPIEFWYQVRAG